VAVLGIAACTRAESQGGLAMEVKLPGGYGQISNVVELRDGRVAFADTRNKLFLTADLESGRVDTVGTRVDSVGPGTPADRYKFPGWVAHLAGDTVALVDFSAVRTTLWSEKGDPLGVLNIPVVAGQTPVLAYDQVGHGYKIDYQAVLGGGEPGGTIRPDSIAVLRIALNGEPVTPSRCSARPSTARPVSASRCSRRRRCSRRTTSSASFRTAPPGWREAGRTGWTGARPTDAGRWGGTTITRRSR
jgi:hypothetical protein